MEYKIQDLIDILLFQRLQDKLNEIYSFPSAILDNEGNILTATAWQDICTKFHRVNPKSELECRKSDQYINKHLHEASPAITYNCPLGLCDNATPIIIDGKHVGTFFTGQFFLKKPDIEFFIKQAKQYGFEENAYLEAVSKVPVWSEERLHQYLSVIKAITEILATIGYENLKDTEERKIIEENLADLKRMEFNLHKSENRFKQIAENSSDFIWEVDANGLYTYCNNNILKILGYSTDEVVGQKYFYDFLAPDIRKELKAAAFQAFERKEPFRNFINRNIHKNGQTIIFETSGSPILDDERNLIGYCGANTDITESKHIEDALKKSEQEYHALFEDANDAILILREETFIQCNPITLDIFGCGNKEDIVNHSPWEFSPTQQPDGSDSREKALSIINAASKGEPQRFYWKHLKKNRDLFDADVSLNQVVLGNEIFIQAIVRDITEIKKAEQELQQSREAFKNYFEIGSVGMCVTSPEKHWIEVNARLCQMFGYSKEEIKQYTWADLTHPDDLAADVELFDQVLSGERNSYDLDKRFIRKDGSILYTTLSVTCQRNEDGTLHHILASLIDITERKRLDTALRESEELYRDLIAMIPDGVYKSTRDGKFIEVNPAMVRMLGYESKEELLALDIKTQLYFQERDRYSNELEDKLEELKLFRLRKKDGSELWAEDNCRYIKDGQGKIIYHEGILRDITDIRKVEIQLTKQTEELKILNATKDKFFSIIAHDLKNPFNTILGFTDVLITNFQEIDNNEILKYLNIIDDTSKRAFTLLENLLIWARTQTDTIDFQPELIDLHNLILEVIKLIENQAKKKSISVSSSAIDHCLVVVDKNMIETILRNLLTNAVKFTPENGVIFVSTVKVNNQIEVSIRDTGVGISKDDLEYIFRIEKKTTTLGTEKEKGTGLGLILCKEFVEKHGGKIWIESKLGHGSIFKFTIPSSK